MNTRSIAALSTLAMLCIALRGFAQQTNSEGGTNAPSPAGTNAAALVDEGPAITGKVLALRDKDGKFYSVKILADNAVYNVNLDEKAEELAGAARFKTVKAHGTVEVDKPASNAPPRRVLTVTSFALIEASTNSPAELVIAPDATNAPANPAPTNAPAAEAKKPEPAKP